MAAKLKLSLEMANQPLTTGAIVLVKNRPVGRTSR
jgi:hypothetical protein